MSAAEWVSPTGVPGEEGAAAVGETAWVADGGEVGECAAAAAAAAELLALAVAEGASLRV